MKKILALVMAMTMGMGLVACGSSTSADTAAADTTTETTESTDAAADTTAADGDASYLIGICQLVQHPALDAATQGFKDALTEQFSLMSRMHRVIPIPVLLLSTALFQKERT